MINELGELLLQDDLNRGNYINAVAKWDLVHVLKTAGIKARFGDVMADESAQLA